MTYEMSMSDYRYEMKYFISDLTYNEVESIVRLHPFQFTEVFPQRFINNIYYDTLNYDSMNDNISGVSNRIKTRIRWYGDLFGHISKPKLELKIKRGLLGKKGTSLFPPFDLLYNFKTISSPPSLDVLNDSINYELRGLKPVLLNRYLRKYFLSSDKKIRLTVDQNQTFHHITQLSGVSYNKIYDDCNIVLELKYESVYEEEAYKISSYFPFRLTKSSKYVRGLALLLHSG
jgi:hypothetical protein